MSQIKKLLKSAKAAIEHGDPDSALEFANDALEIDDKCFFAYLFKGKSYQLLRQFPQAIQAFQIATQIEPGNLLAWKGYFQIVRTLPDYVGFFRVVIELFKIQVDQGLSLGETIRDVKNYLDMNSYKSNDELYEYYLRLIIPGGKLGEYNLESPESSLKKLLDFKYTRLDKIVQGILAKERVKFGRILTVDQKAKLDTIAWNYHQESDLSELFESFLNVCNDDELRRKYQENYLKYKYELLKFCPDKSEMFKDIMTTVDDMILLKTTSLFCWNLFFNWNDAPSIYELDEDKIITYLQAYQNEGLGLILFAFVMSEISPYNKERVIKSLSLNHQQQLESKSESKQILKLDSPALENDEEDAKVLENLIDEEEEQTDISQYYLPQDEILGHLLEGYNKAKDSILANRIIVNYYLHMREYHSASERCKDGIRLVADVQRTFGIDLEHTKDDFFCSLAIVYTYYEAPKNFNRALHLYDKILETNKSNIKAKVGKGLIFVERGELNQAKSILEEVVQEAPENRHAELEYYWCLVKLGEFEKGKLGLEKFITKITGGDLHSGEIRAVAHYRLSKGYLMEDDTNQENIKQCYSHLIQSLKDYEFYAPSYTLLGILFQDYYGDIDRAQKCFYKAFDLDINEIISARYLVEQATAKNEWEVAQVLSKRVVSEEGPRRLLLRATQEDRAWPYRVLGCGALNSQDDAKAVEWFQNAIRISADDFECWVGLGEAYYNCGRYDAAVKVFQHAITMRESGEIPWTVQYMLGVVTCEMKEYNEGLTYLYSALETNPNEECLISAIYEANIENGKRFITSGFFGRAINAILKALEFIKSAVVVNSSSQKVWKSLGDALKVFTKIQEHLDKVPFDTIIEIFEHIGLNEGEVIEVISDIVILDESITFKHARELLDQGNRVKALLIFIILGSVAGIKVLPGKVNKLLRSTAYYNLGLSLLEAYQLLDNDETSTATYRDHSIILFKKSIQLEPNNANYWIALGNAYFSTSPQISQHCYIKATTLEIQDAEIWINLAVLFLRYGDLKLAQETFLRAQSVAPEDAQSWLGHAVVAEMLGDESKAANYYTHAFTLSKGRLALAQFLYGLSVVNRRVAHGNGDDPRDVETAQELSISNAAIVQYLKYYPEDEHGLSIAVTIAERCKDYTNAIKYGNKLCEILEKKYEENEDESVLENFSLMKAQIGRIYLAIGDYELALENSQVALELIEGNDEDLPEIILSSRVTIGLSYFSTNQFEAALEELKVILGIYSDSSVIVTLIAQILYSHGSEETKQAAIDQLFAHIEEHGSSLIVVLTLGAISLVDNLEEYLGAIKEELQGLSLDELVNDTYREVPKLLTEINHRLQGGSRDNSVWLKYAYLFPFDYNVWKNVSNEMAKAVVTLHDTKVNCLQFSEALLKNGKLRDIQRSLILSPDNQEAIDALQLCL
ncbi:SKI3 [[Candida] subhashii]|uniref:SKI3 n=1 Tax=[Candida] subhashii TaxID=561895 RepID=A0A8J5QIE5_9ASCO|nr:SKI3 [[Candida] subhashii]KAG7663597.1 SKI3 [[Candida] subhashii]